MGAVILDFAGAPRTFHLRLGELVDLEQACGQVGCGVIFQRFATTSFKAMDVLHVLRLGLIGGGMPAQEAEALVRDQMDARPLMVNSALAEEIVLAMMVGVPPVAPGAGKAADQPYDFGQILHSFVQLGLSPDAVRAMRYADFCAMVQAAGGETVAPPSEEEFAEMIRDFKPRVVTRDGGAPRE